MEIVCRLPRKFTTRFTIIAAGVILIGCATTRPPTRALTRAELGVRAAREAGADEASSLDLKRAADKLEQAKKAMAAERYEQARRLAESAQVDAELAQAKAEGEVVRRAADQLQRRVDAIQSEAERESRKPLSPPRGQ